MRVIVALLLMFCLGSCVGAKMKPTKVDIVTITKTKLVKEPAPPPVEVAVVPESCLDALHAAGKISDEGNDFYRRGREQLNIMRDVQQSLAANENTADEYRRQKDLHGILVGDLNDLATATYQYETALKECEEAKP